MLAEYTPESLDHADRKLCKKRLVIILAWLNAVRSQLSSSAPDRAHWAAAECLPVARPGSRDLCRHPREQHCEVEVWPLAQRLQPDPMHDRARDGPYYRWEISWFEIILLLLGLGGMLFHCFGNVAAYRFSRCLLAAVTRRAFALEHGTAPSMPRPVPGRHRVIPSGVLQYAGLLYLEALLQFAFSVTCFVLPDWLFSQLARSPGGPHCAIRTLRCTPCGALPLTPSRKKYMLCKRRRVG
jgi:hypothetical protein